MANKRIIDLTTTTTPSGYVALDHETNGTKKLDVAKIAPVDSALSSSSTNAVQNKVINTALSGKLATNGNSQNNTVAFTSGDVANDAAATSWTANVATLVTGLTHANLFNRISTMMKNVRYLYNAVTKLNKDAYLLTGGIELPKNNYDLNNYRTPGNYYSYEFSLPSNSPFTTATSFLLKVESTAGKNKEQYIRQTIIIYNENNTIYERFSATLENWSVWVKRPQRSDIDTINTSISTKQNTIKYKDVTFSDITIPSSGYYDINSYKPNMNHFLFSGINTWNNIVPPVAITITVDGHYVIAAPDTIIAGLQVRYYYTD